LVSHSPSNIAKAVSFIIAVFLSFFEGKTLTSFKQTPFFIASLQLKLQSVLH